MAKYLMRKSVPLAFFRKTGYNNLYIPKIRRTLYAVSGIPALLYLPEGEEVAG